MVLPLIAAAGIGAGANLLGGFFGSKAKKKQARRNIADYTGAETNAIAAQKPFYDAGSAGIGRANAMMTPGFQYSPSDPSYAWRFGQGLQANRRGAVARGAFDSGGTLQALTDYGQGAASQEFAADFGRNNELARFGAHAADNMQNAYFAAADGRSGNRTAIGNANAGFIGQAAGTVGRFAGMFTGGAGGGGGGGTNAGSVASFFGV